MKIYKAMVAVDDGVYKIDAIDYEGKLWLVPHWLDMPAQGVTMPNRIIRFDILPHAKSQGGSWDFLLHSPIPKELIANETPQAPVAGYEFGHRLPSPVG
jgi:hypothetical protein